MKHVALIMAHKNKALFARKFDDKVDGKVLDMIDEKLLKGDI